MLSREGIVSILDSSVAAALALCIAASLAFAISWSVWHFGGGRPIFRLDFAKWTQEH